MIRTILGVVAASCLSLTAHATDWEAYAREMLADAVSKRTVLPGPHYPIPQFAEDIRARLVAGGFAAADIEVVPVADSAYLVARYQGTGEKKPILLSAHMDVVDANPADWERDPFTLVEENGMMFGRGVGDNKFGLTMMVTTLLRFKAEGFVPNRDLVLVFTGDEETTMATTRVAATRFPDAEMMLSGDDMGGFLDSAGKPLYYAIQGAEKTYAEFWLSTTDPGGHSSKPRQRNAIYLLADALLRLQNNPWPAEQNEITREFFRYNADVVGGEVGAAMAAFAKDPEDAAAIDVLAASPTYVGLTRTTCIPTLFEAGHARNALPQSAKFLVNCRIFPGTSIEAVRERLIELVDNPEVEIVQYLPESSVASDASPLRKDLMAALRKAVDANYPGTPIVPKMAAGASDAMWFRAAGIPSYVVPGLYQDPANDSWHGENERTPRIAIAQGLRHWHVLLSELAGGS